MAETKLKALLVEDEQICRLSEKRLLEDCGFTVDAAETAVSALDLLNESVLSDIEDSYDIVFMDICLPDIEGHKVTDVIRKTEDKIKAIPIVAVTAHADPEEVEGYFKTGITDIIEKPLTKQNVQDILTKYFED
jgi:CheY-like chemotaxis protein